MKKLAIVEDREEDKYTHVTTVKCWKCDPAQGAELPPDAQVCTKNECIPCAYTRPTVAATIADRWHDAQHFVGAPV